MTKPTKSKTLEPGQCQHGRYPGVDCNVCADSMRVAREQVAKLVEAEDKAKAVLEEQRLTKEEADINSLYAEFCDWNQFKRVEVLKTLRERATTSTSSEHSDDIQAAWACAYVLFRDHKRK